MAMFTSAQKMAADCVADRLYSATKSQRYKAQMWVLKEQVNGREVSPAVESAYRRHVMQSPGFMEHGFLLEFTGLSVFPFRLTLPNGGRCPIVYSMGIDELVDTHESLVAILKRDPLARGDLIDELKRRFIERLLNATPVVKGH